MLVSMNKEEEVSRTDEEKLSNPNRKGSKRRGEGNALEKEMQLQT